MEDMQKSLKQATQAIDQTTALFYQQKQEEGYKQLEGTLLLLIKTMSQVFEYKLDGHDIGVEESQFTQVLTQAMQAMEIKDTVLLSDILQYELKDLFEKVMATL